MLAGFAGQVGRACGGGRARWVQLKMVTGTRCFSDHLVSKYRSLYLVCGSLLIFLFDSCLPLFWPAKTTGWRPAIRASGWESKAGWSGCPETPF